MKLNLFASALLFVSAMTISAQDRPQKANKGNRENRQQPSEEMIKGLNLSDKQVTEWNEIQESNRKTMQTQRQANKDADNMTREERRSKMEEIRKANREQIQNILTKEQYVKYLEIEKDKAGNSKGSKKKGKGRK